MKEKKPLAVLRKEKHMSQRELASRLNISPGAIGMYESGKRTPPLNRAIRIAELFNVSVENIEFANTAEQALCEDMSFQYIDGIKKDVPDSGTGMNLKECKDGDN